MPPRLRKAALAVHLTLAVGWIGAVVAFLAMVIGAMTRADDATLRAAWIAMELTGWFAILPLAVASVATGLVMSLGTRWGLLRHWWTLLSFALAVAALLVLVSNLQTVSAFARLAADPAADAGGLRAGLSGELLHAGLGLVVLLVIQALNVYKPPGMTRYGRRKQREEGAPARASL